MSSELDRVTKNLGRLAATYERLPRDMVAASARVFKTTIDSEINAVTRGGKLRHVGKHGSRVGVKYDIRTQGTGAATAVVQATGQLQIIEKDTKPHMIPRVRSVKRTRTASGRLSKTRADGGRDLSGRKHLYINGTWVIGPVKHPGTKGKHPFAKGTRRAEVPAAIAAHRAEIEPIARIFP